MIFDLLREKGIIDMGIRKEASLAEAALSIRRRKNHRAEVLNEVEVVLDSVET